MRRTRTLSWVAGALLLIVGASSPTAAQESNPKQIVQKVVGNELAADAADQSRWLYRDAKKTPERTTVKMVVETPHGDVSKLVEINGKEPDNTMREQDRAHRQSFISDKSMQQRQARDHHDDDQKACAMMKMLPDAFIWTQEGESNGQVRLRFKPNPKFDPPTRDARVFAAMAGTMVADSAQMRLISLKGTLTQDVDFGWGILGKLRQGGTFNVERREIAPNIWQIVETHVHINGRALLFKSIDQNEDEIQSNWRQVSQNLSLAQAAEILEKSPDQLAQMTSSASRSAAGNR